MKDPTYVVAIIAAVFLGLGQLLTTWKSLSTARKVDLIDIKADALKDNAQATAYRTDDKLQDLHEQGDGNLKVLRQALSDANARIAKQEAMLGTLMERMNAANVPTKTVGTGSAIAEPPKSETR